MPIHQPSSEPGADPQRPGCGCAPPVQLLIVPGLGDSGPGHWQTWLQGLVRPSTRVVQRHWREPDLERWSARIGSTAEHLSPGPCIAVAHSFGVLALAHHLATTRQSPIRAALLVAPADPDRFGLGELLPRSKLPVPITLVLSQTDPWLPASVGQRWAAQWGSPVVNLGDVGHINVASGFGAFPFAQRWVTAMTQRLHRERRAQEAPVAPHAQTAYASTH
jgi:hypothetical protein